MLSTLSLQLQRSKEKDFSTPDVHPHMRISRHNLGTHHYEAIAEFRLDRESVISLADLLLPPLPGNAPYRTPQSNIFNNVEGLCMVLKRLAYPFRYLRGFLTCVGFNIFSNRWRDMGCFFGRPYSTCCSIYTTTLEIICANWVCSSPTLHIC